MFLHASVILFTGGSCVPPTTYASRHTCLLPCIPPLPHMPPTRHACPPSTIWSISGRYASYWNASIFSKKGTLLITINFLKVCTAHNEHILINKLFVVSEIQYINEISLGLDMNMALVLIPSVRKIKLVEDPRFPWKLRKIDSRLGEVGGKGPINDNHLYTGVNTFPSTYKGTETVLSALAESSVSVNTS